MSLNRFTCILYLVIILYLNNVSGQMWRPSPILGLNEYDSDDEDPKELVNASSSYALRSFTSSPKPHRQVQTLPYEYDLNKGGPVTPAMLFDIPDDEVNAGFSQMLSVEEQDESMKHGNYANLGTYTTETFYYFNHQFMNRINHRNYTQKCIDQYLRCIFSIKSNPQRVCVVHDPRERPNSYYTLISVCETYFDECRRVFKFWRTLDAGLCVLFSIDRNTFYFSLYNYRRIDIGRPSLSSSFQSMNKYKHK